MADPTLERILVTGGMGFIGRHVLDELIRDGYRPMVTSLTGRFTEGQIPYAGIDQVSLDIVDFEKTNQLIREIRPQAVIHLAGATGHGDPTGEICHRVNFLGTVNLLKALQSAGTKRTIILGSAAEYGDQTTPFGEDMATRPVSHYGISKARATEAALEMHAATGFSVTVLRVFSAFGVGQPPKMFLSQLITHALMNKHFRMSAGRQKRDYIDATEVAGSIMAALNTEEASGRIVNIGSGRGTVLRMLAERVWELCDAEKRLLDIGARATTGDDEFDTEADITLAQKILDWRPEISILPTDGKIFALPEMIDEMRSRLSPAG